MRHSFFPLGLALCLAGCGGDQSPVSELLGTWSAETPLIANPCDSPRVKISEESIEHYIGNTATACFSTVRITRVGNTIDIEAEELDAIPPDAIIENILTGKAIPQLKCDRTRGNAAAYPPARFKFALRDDGVFASATPERILFSSGLLLARYPASCQAA